MRVTSSPAAAPRPLHVGAVTVMALGLVLGLLLGLAPATGASAAARPAAKATKAATKKAAFAGRPLFVSHTPSKAALAKLDATKPRTSAAAKETARRKALLRKIAGQSQAQWVGDWVPTAKARATVASLTAGARRSGAVLPLVVYNLPYRDCGSYSKGGAGTARAYRAWIDQVAAGIGTTRAIVVLEPDALAGMDCLPRAAQDERLALLRYAGARLSAQRNTAVYLDAGNALWKPAGVMAQRLAAAGVAKVRGFALNTSNFDTTTNEVRYGRQIAAALGGKPFVVDTSRNGRGATTGSLAWCNPAGRGLGSRPTTNPKIAGVDALLWVKTVGASDGNCRRGELPAGTYSLSYALGLAQRANW